MNHESEQKVPLTANQGISLLFLVARLWAQPIELLLRYRFGRRFVDGWFFVALTWPFLFVASYDPSSQLATVNVFAALIFALGIVHRVMAVHRDRNGFQEHSYHDGYPYLCRFLRLPESITKVIFDPILAIIIGACLQAYHPALGAYFIGGAFFMAIKRAMIEHVWEQRDWSLQDSLIEQRALGERLRRPH